jgi:hypothetical protein
MTKYYLYMKQKSGGCDYTIACGEILILLKSDNIGDAYEEAKEKVEYYGARPGHDYELKKLVVLEVSNSYDFLDDINGEFLEQEKLSKYKDIKEKELKELERLREKYKM